MLQNINQTSTDINRRKVLVTTSSKTLQKLQKSVEDATIDRDKGTKEKERLVAEFKEIESKAFVTQEKYTHLQEVSFISAPLKLLLGYINNLLYDITNGLFFIKQWTDAHVNMFSRSLMHLVVSECFIHNFTLLSPEYLLSS
jgi:hypothetical protein